MKKIILLLLVTFMALVHPQKIVAQADTVHTGIYVTSIHNIDFKEMEYTVNFWLWLKYKNKDFDFLQNLEVPNAKSVVQSFSTIDTTGGNVYILMKLQCVMKDSWKIHHFPFDRQTLRISVENSQFDSKSLVFDLDTSGKHFDPKFTLSGWDIDSFNVFTNVKEYETAFGDESLTLPHSEYSAFNVNIGMQRRAMGLFWKMFLGMYVSFLIAYMCFYIHADSVESRFGLSVGSLFAVIGNKYIIDSSLPESITFTLVDTLHAFTLLFIFAVIISTVVALKLVNENRIKQANRFDRIAAQVLLVIYVLLNVYYITQANMN